jgi:hypothetical protein
MTISALRPSALGSFGLLAVCLASASLRAADRDPTSANQNAAPAEKPENPLRLSEEQRKAAGIVVAKPAAVTLAPQVDGYGRVLEATSLVTLLAEGETAQAALTASEKELARVKSLFQHGANASAQAVETAEANLARDRAAANSARLRLVTGWGRSVADPTRAAELRTALAQGAVIARIDVLPGDEPAESIKTIAVRRAGGVADVSAEVLGPATSVDPQVQGRGLLVLIREGAFPVGAALRAMLPGVGESTPAFVVPRSAVVYHQGSAWVYVLGEKDTFERQRVAIAHSVEGGIALQGIAADSQVATTGAEELLAAELQISGSPGDERD